MGLCLWAHGLPFDLFKGSVRPIYLLWFVQASTPVLKWLASSARLCYNFIEFCQFFFLYIILGRQFKWLDAFITSEAQSHFTPCTLPLSPSPSFVASRFGVGCPDYCTDKGWGGVLGLNSHWNEDFPGSISEQRAMRYSPEDNLNLWPWQPNGNIFLLIKMFSLHHCCGVLV